MDDIDRKLLLLLTSNPRVRFRELASKLGISRQAVHHRVKVMKDTGILIGLYTGISINYLNAVPVVIFGISKTSSVEKTFDKLGKNTLTRRALICGGNYLYVVGYLRDISDLGVYSDFVIRTAEVTDPTVGIYCLNDGLMPHYEADGSRRREADLKELSPLDISIVDSLKENARRPVSEIAKAVGASAKTVRRHLESMISSGSVEFSYPVDMQAGGDMLFIIHVTTNDGVDKIAFGRRILSKDTFLDQYVRTFTNLPNLLTWVFWSDKLTEARKALREISDDEDVRSTLLNLAYLERVYPTWRYQLPSVASAAPRKARSRKPRRRTR